MCCPQVKSELFGRPARLAGLTGTLRNRRTIATACRPVATPAFTHSLRMFQPGRICGDFEISMSTSRDAFLGHCAVSDPCAQAKLEHEGFRECAQKSGAER